MAKSTVTRQHRTTIPREIRETLGLRPGDILRWEVFGNEIRVTAADPAFLGRKGIFKVGSGSVVEDIRIVRGGGLGSRIAARFAGSGLTEGLPEFHAVLLDPEVAEAFKDSEMVNRALRLLLDLAR